MSKRTALRKYDVFSPRPTSTIGVSEFKARCLKLLEETKQKGREWIITKKSQPVARVIPIGRKQGSRQGALKGLATLEGDIVHWSSVSDWEASS